MYGRLDLLTSALIMGAVLSFSGALTAQEKQNQPNIVFFLSDDHGWRDSGAYGDPYVKTPNIDRLAKESMLFTHAFSAAPLCNPARNAITSGLMPMRNGHHTQGGGGGGRPTKVTKFTPLPNLMEHLGYFTACFGKQGCKGEYNLKKDLGSYHGFPDQHRKDLISFIHDYDRKAPLYLEVRTFQPHLPWVKNTEYDPDRIPLPPNFVDTPQTRLDRADYYTDITVMDSVLGGVMDALKQRGMDRNTLFVYSSDQGSNWPFGKWCVYDGGLRVPLIVRWPGKVTAGTRTDALVGLIDLLPTFVQAGGGVPPGNIDGKSIMGVLTGEKQEHRHLVFGTHSGSGNGPKATHNLSPMRTVRTPTHRYILNLRPEMPFANHITASLTHSEKERAMALSCWSTWEEKAKTDSHAKETVHRYVHRPQEELYRLGDDPYEMNNLADDPAQAELLKTFRRQLAEWCEVQGDSFALETLRTMGDQQLRR